MKKLILVLIICSGSFLSRAQELGIRFGKVAGNNVALDALFSSGNFSRIHGDISFGSGVGVDLLWDFMYKPIKEIPLNWYLGAGPTMLIDDPFYLGVSGEAGVDYHFDKVPISLSIDWRPTFYLIQETHFTGDGFGFNIRYVFGKKA